VVPPGDDGRTVTFKPRRIGDGLELLTDGVVPLYATRADGWTISVDAPMSEPMPTWLLDAFGGRRRRASPSPRARAGSLLVPGTLGAG